MWKTLLLIAAFAASAAIPARASEQELRHFLSELGFRDYSRELRANAAALRVGAREPLHAGTRAVLEAQAPRYEGFSDAREVAVAVGSELERRGADRALRKAVIKLTAGLLKLRPRRTKTGIPLQLSRVQMQFAEYFGQHRPDVDARLARLVHFLNADSLMGRTRLLGRALAAVVLRHAALQVERNAWMRSDSDDLSRELRLAVLAQGERLNDFIGTTLDLESIGAIGETMNGISGGVERGIWTLRTGDFALIRSTGATAGAITWGARPAPENLARSLGRSGWSDPLVSLAVTQGYSHIGLIWVAEADGIRMPWVLDTMMGPGGGGIRITGLREQFADPSAYARLALVRYGSEEFLRSVQGQVAWEPFRPVVWRSEGGDWRSPLDDAEFRRLHFEMPVGSSADAWHAEVASRAVAWIIERFLLKDGVAFAPGVRDVFGRAYCSQMIALAFLLSSGADLEAVPDVWDPLIVAGHRIGVADDVGRGLGRLLGASPANLEALTLDPSRRIIAPAGVLWQPMVSAYADIRLRPRGRIEERLLLPYPTLGDDLLAGASAAKSTDSESRGRSRRERGARHGSPPR